MLRVKCMVKTKLEKWMLPLIKRDQQRSIQRLGLLLRWSALDIVQLNQN